MVLLLKTTSSSSTLNATFLLGFNAQDQFFASSSGNRSNQTSSQKEVGPLNFFLS